MMKNFKKIALSFLGVAFIATGFVACSNDDSNTKTDTQIENRVKSVSSVFDYDVYGRTHNEYLDYLSQHPNYDNLSFEEKVSYGSSFSNNHIDFSTINIDVNTLDSSIQNVIMGLTSEEGVVSYMYKKGMLHSDELELANKLINLFDDAVDPEKETYKSIPEFNAEIESFQNFVRSNYEIKHTNNEVSLGAKYLAASSIAKHSYQFWVDAAGNINSPYYKYLGDDYLLGNKNERTTYGRKRPGLFKRIWDGIKIGAADVGGFLGNACDPYQSSNGNCVITIESLETAWYAGGEASDEAIRRRGY